MAGICAALLIGASSAQAHHSATAMFDLQRTATLKGVFSQVSWINPHVTFAVVSKAADGRTETWRFETRPPGYFIREGVAKADLEGFIGQQVTVLANPARDGSRAGWALKIDFADGAQLVLPGE